MKRQYVFFDLGWTLEDETESQIDRARDTADVLAGLGIIANQFPGSEQRLQRYGIRHLLDHVLASAELGLAKPDPRIFALAREKAKCDPGDAWMTGDRLENDIAPANRLGWNTIRVLQGYNALQEPRNTEEEPDFTVTELAEIVSIALTHAS